MDLPLVGYNVIAEILKTDQLANRSTKTDSHPSFVNLAKPKVEAIVQFIHNDITTELCPAKNIGE